MEDFFVCEMISRKKIGIFRCLLTVTLSCFIRNSGDSGKNHIKTANIDVKPIATFGMA